MAETPVQHDANAKVGFTLCGIHRDPETEFAYRQSHAQLIGRHTLATSLIAALVFFGALPYDYFAFPLTPPFWTLLAIRTGGLLMGLWLAFEAYNYRDATKSRLAPTLVLFEVYLSAGFLGIVWIHGGDAAFHTMSAMAMVLAFYVFLPNFARTQILLPPVFSLFFLGCLYFLLNEPADQLFIPAIILLLVNALGWQFARLNNQARRLEYINLRTQHHLNDELRAEIAERHQAEENLQQLFDAAPVPMVLSRGRDGIVLRANKLALNLFSVQPHQLNEVRAPQFYVNPEQRYALFERIHAEGQVRAQEVNLLTFDGKPFDGLLSANRIEYEGDPDCVFVGVMDITELNRIKEELEQLVNIDMLTGINNRRAFFSTCERELRRRNRNGERISIMMIDIDEFKRINDNYGHAQGDEVLKAIATRLQAHIREFDILGRIGGEEFAIMLPGLDAQAAREVAERLRQEVRRPLAGVNLAESGLSTPLTMTISIGIAEVSHDAHKIDTALSQADHAMYRAKHRGRDRVEVADERIEE